MLGDTEEPIHEILSFPKLSFFLYFLKNLKCVLFVLRRQRVSLRDFQN